MRMIEELSVLITQKRISAFIGVDSVYFCRHCRIVDFYADDTDKLPFPVNRCIIRDHPYIKIIRDVGCEPDRSSFMLRNGEPHQL